MLHCRLGWIWNHLGDMHLVLSVRVYLDLAEKGRPTLNVSSAVPWVGPRLHKESWLSPISVLSGL